MVFSIDFPDNKLRVLRGSTHDHIVVDVLLQLNNLAVELLFGCNLFHSESNLLHIFLKDYGAGEST